MHRKILIYPKDAKDYKTTEEMNITNLYYIKKYLGFKKHNTEINPFMKISSNNDDWYWETRKEYKNEYLLMILYLLIILLMISLIIKLSNN